MRILLLEDEPLAAERLRELIRRCRPAAEVIAMLDSVEDAVDWLRRHAPPDLAFCDIHLADGLSFRIFEHEPVRFPIIFTTAYDQYALRAFKANGIDYLLKPVDPAELNRAFLKWEELRGRPPAPVFDLEALQTAFRPAPIYRTRFMVSSGHYLVPITTDDILYFYSENKITWLRRSNGDKHGIDLTLEQLTDQLDPAAFFRINRQYIVAARAVGRLMPYSNSRLRVELPHVPAEEKVIVSRERVGEFKGWLGG